VRGADPASSGGLDADAEPVDGPPHAAEPVPVLPAGVVSAPPAVARDDMDDGDGDFHDGYDDDAIGPAVMRNLDTSVTRPRNPDMGGELHAEDTSESAKNGDDGEGSGTGVSDGSASNRVLCRDRSEVLELQALEGPSADVRSTIVEYVKSVLMDASGRDVVTHIRHISECFGYACHTRSSNYHDRSRVPGPESSQVRESRGGSGRSHTNARILQS